MKRLVPERRRNSERAAVERRPGGGGGQCADVTGGAPDPVKSGRATARPRPRGQERVPCRSFGGTHETGETVDIREPGGIRLVVGLGDGVADPRHLVWEQP